MRCWLLSLGALLAGTMTLGRAEYIRITYILSPETKRPAVATQGSGQFQGGGAPGRGGRGRPGRGSMRSPDDAGPSEGPSAGQGSPVGRPSAMQNNEDELKRLLENQLNASVVVEYTKAGLIKVLGVRGAQGFPEIYHRWGKTGLMATNDVRLAFIQEKNIPLRSIRARYESRRKQMLGGDLTPAEKAQRILDLARWALLHGMVEEIPHLMEELAQARPDEPAVKTYQEVQAAMDRPITKPDTARVWKEKLGNYRIKQSAHYNLLYSGNKAESAEARDALSHLEHAYRGFFYWFALRGTAIPVPEQRLTAVLVERPDIFQAHREVFDDPPLVADGFYARRDNLVFCSAVRLDPAFKALTAATKSLWESGWSKERLLHGEGKEMSSPEQVIRNQMIALMVKAMQEESVLATISHLAVQQLATTVGLMPSSVEVPRWIRFGMGSYFETPKGAYWPGIGAPSWLYLAQYKLWEDRKQLDKSDDALRRVVTDEYFRNPGGDQAQGILKARTMAWGLYYFLAETRLDGLMRYFEELSQLPRDMEFDDEVLLSIFGKAFGLTDSKAPYQLNQEKFRKLAVEWYDFLHYTNFEASEAYTDALSEIKQQANQLATPPSKKKKGGDGREPWN